jgi:hypothetical protein
MLVKFNKDDEFSIMYANETRRYHEGKVVSFYEKEEDKIRIPVDRKNDLDSFHRYIEVIFNKKNYEIVIIRSS